MRHKESLTGKEQIVALPLKAIDAPVGTIHLPTPLALQLLTCLGCQILAVIGRKAVDGPEFRSSRPVRCPMGIGMPVVASYPLTR